MTNETRATCPHCGSEEIAMVNAVAHYGKDGNWIVETFLGAPSIECHNCNTPSSAPVYAEKQSDARQLLTYGDRASWLQTIWDAIHDLEDCTELATDRENDIKTAMAWITEEMGMENTPDGIADIVRDGAQSGHTPAQTAFRFKLESMGFASGSTGGGCEGATLELPDGYQILIADELELATAESWAIDASRDGEPLYFAHNDSEGAPATIRDAIERALIAIYDDWLNANSLSAMCAEELRSELVDDATFYARKEWREKWTEVGEQIDWLDAFIGAWDLAVIKAH